MPGESLNFPIFAEDHASKNIRAVGDAAAVAGAKLDFAAGSAKLWNDTAMKSGKANDTLIQSQLAVVKATRALGDAERFTAGEADKATRLMAGQADAFDKTGKSAEKAAGSGGTTGLSALIGSGGAGAGGMAGLIAAAVVLSPMITSLAFGLGGFGLAAVGAAAPILKAAQATGGLAANMAKLNPEQQKVAEGLLGLQHQYDAFQKALEPQVLNVFNKGIQLAGDLLHDVQPIAKATGNALGGFLGQIDAEFKSGTWQQFFGFMARTAGPDVKQLGGLFVALMQDLPPLVQALQPLAEGLIHVTTDAARAAQPLGTFATNAAGSAHKSDQAAKSVDSWTVAWTNRWIPGAKTVNRLLGDVQHAAGGTTTGFKNSGDAAAGAVPKVFDLNTAVTNLNTSMTTLVGNLFTLQGSNLTWKQSMQAAETQLKSNSAGLEGNSKNALANKQAVLATSNAALSFAQQELSTGKNIGGASRTVQDQINWLQHLHDKSAFVRDEIKALRKEEILLEAQRLNQHLNVTASGSWTIAGQTGKTRISPGPGMAAGGMIGGGIPGKDSVLIAAMPGEVVIPTALVAAGAVDHLRGSLPGFAAGGVVPRYSGDPGGLTPWVRHNDTATIALIDQAVVKATLAGIRAAARAAQTFAGGLGKAGLRQIENWWIGAGGPGGGTAHVAAAITGAESGFNVNAIQQGQPYATTGWGLWQITPGNSEPQFGTDYALLNGPANARAAVAKYRGAGGFSPWTTFEDGAYLQFMDNGGWLHPGRNLVQNNTGQPERVLGPGQGGNTYNVNITLPPGSDRDQGRRIVGYIRSFEMGSGASWRGA